jgi:4-amino-4-deoxy-L-arabinose transferase-like glycosyltransferase
VDSSRYFTQAKHLEIYGIGYFFKEWGKDIFAWTDLPLIPFLYGLIFKFFGESRIYLQIFITILFSGTVVLTYMIGKTLWDEDIGLFAGALLLGIPYLLTQVPIMLVDVPTMFFFTLSIFVFIKALERGGVGLIALSSITLFFAFFAKYSTWLMLSVTVIIFLVFLKGDSKGVLYRSSIIAFIAGILILCMVLAMFNVISEQITLLLDYQRPGLRRWGESFTSTFLFQIHPFITAAAVYSIYVAWKKRDLKFAIISWLLILVVAMKIERIRYVILVFPMVALMASYGLQTIKVREMKKFVMLCIVISSLVVAFFGYLPFVGRISTVNLKDAGGFLNSIDAERVEVFTLPQKYSIINPAVSVPILDLFTKKRVNYISDGNHSPPWKQIEKSPLRFTWEYKNPKYYRTDNMGSKDGTAVAIILSDINQTLPKHIEQKIKGYRISKTFKINEGVFRYRTIVTIYQPAT